MGVWEFFSLPAANLLDSLEIIISSAEFLNNAMGMLPIWGAILGCVFAVKSGLAGAPRRILTKLLPGSFCPKEENYALKW